MEAALNPPSPHGLYDCHVMHKRLWPKIHDFSYRIFMFYLDLNDLDSLQSFWVKIKKRGFYQFDPNLYLPSYTTNPDLKERLYTFLRDQQQPLPQRITLLTNLKCLGYTFNPVSFFICFDETDQPYGVIAEVGNTFLEKKPYWIPRNPQDGEPFFSLKTVKHFYVSPFSPLDWSFDFRIRLPQNRLVIGIHDIHPDGKTTLVSTLIGSHHQLTDWRIFLFTLRYPLITLKVILTIHWQAFWLWLKGLTVHPKHDNPDQQTQVLNPHASLIPESAP